MLEWEHGSVARSLHVMPSLSLVYHGPAFCCLVVLVEDVAVPVGAA